MVTSNVNWEARFEHLNKAISCDQTYYLSQGRDWFMYSGILNCIVEYHRELDLQILVI